jgi:hypothetical protein
MIYTTAAFLHWLLTGDDMPADANPMPRFHLWRNQRGDTTATICLVILATIALCWFFGIHVHAAG